MFRVSHKELERVYSDARCYEVKAEIRAMTGTWSNDYVPHYSATEGDRELMKLSISASLYLSKPNDLEAVKQETTCSAPIKYETQYGSEIGLYEAQAAVKMLSSVERKLEALRQREGYSKSFGQTVNRLARILGIDWAIVSSKRDKSWIWCNLGDMPGMVDGLFDSWKWGIVRELEDHAA